MPFLPGFGAARRIDAAVDLNAAGMLDLLPRLSPSAIEKLRRSCDAGFRVVQGHHEGVDRFPGVFARQSAKFGISP